MRWITQQKPLLSALMIAGALAYAGAGNAGPSDDASATAVQPPESTGTPGYPSSAEVQAIVPDRTDTPDSAFQKMDADGKGYVSEEDAAALPGFEEAFRSADTDGDGQLSPDEFENAWANYSGITQ